MGREAMRRWVLSLGMGSALIGLLAIGVTRSASASMLDFTGTLAINMFGLHDLPGNRFICQYPVSERHN